MKQANFIKFLFPTKLYFIEQSIFEERNDVKIDFTVMIHPTDDG